LEGRELIVLSILFLIGSFYYPQKSIQFSFLIGYLNSKFKPISANLKINFENSFNIKSASNLWNFLTSMFNSIIVGNTTDLILFNIYFSVFLNFEILLLGNVSSVKFFQLIFFISNVAPEYLLDLSMIEHSLTIEKSLLDFSTDLFGFYKTMRHSVGTSLLLIDNISRVFYDTVIILRLKIKINSEKNFIFLKISNKPAFNPTYVLSFSKACIDLTTRFSMISFFPISFSNYNFLKIETLHPNFLKTRVIFPIGNSFHSFSTKLTSINEIVTSFIDFFWYKTFFSINHQFNHFLISLILITVVFINPPPTKIGWISGFNHLITILNFEKIATCFKNLIKNTIRKKSLITNILMLRLFSFYFLFLKHSSCVVLRIEKKEYNILLNQSFIFKTTKKKALKLVMKNIYRIPRFRIKQIKRVFFSIKNVKIFSTVNLLRDCTENSKIYDKIETEIHLLIVKTTGFKPIVSLLLFLFSIIKKKALFSHIVQLVKKKNQKLREMIKNRANRFVLVKVLIKSSLRRLKISRISILENLIPFRLVNVNYLPRGLLERRLTDNLLLYQNFETVTFFYNRITNWKQTTRVDRNSLLEFLKISNKKEKKIAIKTLLKVRKAKKLFNNGIVNFCSNFLEAISYFVSFKSYNLLNRDFFALKDSMFGLSLLEIKDLRFFYNLYLRRISLCYN